MLHRVPGKTEGGLLQTRWLPGTWLGKRWATNEHVVALPSGKVVRARVIQEVPEAERWNKQHILGVVGVPWAAAGTVTYRDGRPLLVDLDGEAAPSPAEGGG